MIHTYEMWIDICTSTDGKNSLCRMDWDGDEPVWGRVVMGTHFWPHSALYLFNAPPVGSADC